MAGNTWGSGKWLLDGWQMAKTLIHDATSGVFLSRLCQFCRDQESPENDPLQICFPKTVKGVFWLKMWMHVVQDQDGFEKLLRNGEKDEKTLQAPAIEIVKNRRNLEKKGFVAKLWEVEELGSIAFLKSFFSPFLPSLGSRFQLAPIRLKIRFYSGVNLNSYEGRKVKVIVKALGDLPWTFLENDFLFLGFEHHFSIFLWLLVIDDVWTSLWAQKKWLGIRSEYLGSGATLDEIIRLETLSFSGSFCFAGGRLPVARRGWGTRDSEEASGEAGLRSLEMLTSWSFPCSNEREVHHLWTFSSGKSLPVYLKRTTFRTPERCFLGAQISPNAESREPFLCPEELESLSEQPKSSHLHVRRKAGAT